MEKIENNGWRRSTGLYNLFYYKDIDLENGKRELESLNIDEKYVSIIDDMRRN